MIDREKVKDPRKRILTSCVKMFIEKGYKETTMLDIIKEANVSAGTFQNLFKTKDGVLIELIDFMFSHQFDVASSMIDSSISPIALYAVETAIQIAIVEQNEHLREIYVETYSNAKLINLVHQKTTIMLKKIFSTYLPSWKENDFYEMEIGTAGMMRGYMARPCDMYFTLERKIDCFITASFDIFQVPKAKQEEIKNFLGKLDFKALSLQVMKNLFSQLEMAFDFKFEK